MADSCTTGNCSNPKIETVRVLVIDEEPIIGESVRAALEDIGHTVVSVHSAPEAMKALQDTFDIVFIHRGLPDSSCDEIVRQARIFSGAAIILMSSEKTERAEKNKLRLGADEIVYKPLSMKNLRDIARRYPRVEKDMPDPEPPGSPRIFVVDDDEIVLEAVMDALEDRFEVTGFKSPEKALGMLREIPCEILLSDLMMHEMHGLDFIRAAVNLRPGLVPIVITGYASRRAAIDSMKEGVYDFLEKPLTPNMVLHAVSRAWKGLRYELENRKLLAELRRMNDNLLAEIEERKRTGEELKLAREAAEAANRAKSEFLAGMSHEIRTPMNAILGFADILKLKIRDEQYQKYLSFIQSAGKSLLILIDDILDLSQIEAGKMEFDYAAVNPVGIFREIAGMFSPKIEEKGLKLVMDIDSNMPEYMMLDEIRLRQILFNLAGNAVKFTKRGVVKIAVATRIHDEFPDAVDFIFSVGDTGIGIPDDQKETIFEAFEQRRGQDRRQYGGTGLGLTITKRLVEMMGGAISVTGEQGKGSVFTVVLENVRIAEVSGGHGFTNSVITDSVVFDNAVILIADDLADNRTLLINYLEDYDFLPIEAENGLEACKSAKLLHPDLILMDMKMPVMDGREATKTIKDDIETKDIPVVAVTAEAMKDAAEKISALCDGYLRKPVNKADLIAELRRFLKHSVEKTSPGKLPNIRKRSACNLETLKIPFDLMRIIETEFIPRWEKINDTMILHEMRQFGYDVSRLCREYGFTPLAEYGEHLAELTLGCDIESIEKKMAEFPKIVERIKGVPDPMS